MVKKKIFFVLILVCGLQFSSNKAIAARDFDSTVTVLTGLSSIGAGAISYISYGICKETFKSGAYNNVITQYFVRTSSGIVCIYTAFAAVILAAGSLKIVDDKLHQ